MMTAGSQSPAMSKRITIIQGHPDARGTHFRHALAQAYAEAAIAAGHDVRVIPVARSDFPRLRTARQFTEEPPPATGKAQDDIRWAQHLVNPKGRQRALAEARALGARAT